MLLTDIVILNFCLFSIVSLLTCQSLCYILIFFAITSTKVRNFDFSTWTASFGHSDFHTESAWENFVALNRGKIELSDEV